MTARNHPGATVLVFNRRQHPRQARVRKAQASSLYNPSYAGPSVFGWVGGLVFDSTGCIGAAMLISCSAGFAAAFAAALPNHD